MRCWWRGRFRTTRPWADEAEAWQLARSLSLHDLFHTYLRYEGAPGLWHFLLWVLVRAGVSYSGLHWICGGIALAGVSVLMLASPLPRYLRLVFPFTFFLLFQYAVVARNYVLAPMLLFGVAALWKRRPVLVALLLGLLANVALHAAVISGGLAVVYALQYRGRRRELLPGAALLAGLYGLAMWTAWPPHDLVMPPRPHGLGPMLVAVISAGVWSICEPWILSIPFWIAMVFCFRARRSLVYLLPVALMVTFCGLVQTSFWHVGLLVPLLVSLVWITWPPASERPTRGEVAGRVALVVMLGTQLLWSAHALIYDHVRAYSPDPAAAQFLQPLVRNHARIAVTFVGDPRKEGFFSVGLLPYFDHNIYMNLERPFWDWSGRHTAETQFPAALRSHPEVIVVEVTQVGLSAPLPLDDAKIQLLGREGYRLSGRFCAALPQRMEAQQAYCHLIFQRPSVE